MKRRQFLQTSGAGLAASILAGSGVNVAWAADNSRKRVIYVFLRGGFDVLSMLPPINLNQKVNGVKFMDMRPSLLITTINDQIKDLKANGVSGDLKNLAALTDINADAGSVKSRLKAFREAEDVYQRGSGANFNLSPALHPLTEALNKKELSFIVHTGSEHTTRSHFTQQDLIESGSDQKVQEVGFFAKMMKDSPKVSGRQTLALGQKVPRSLKGVDAALIDTIQDASERTEIKNILTSSMTREERLGMFLNGSGDKIARKVEDAGELARTLAAYESPLRDGDSGDTIRRRFRFAAELVRKAGQKDLNPAVITVDVWGWDTHNVQNSDKYDATALGGKFAVLATELARLRASLKASGEWNNTMVVVMSEFGRTIRENGSSGTDHGRGSAMMLMGPNLVRKHGMSDWNLASVEGDEPGSAALAVKVDYRDVLAQIMDDHLGIANPGAYFHHYNRKSLKIFG